MAIDQMSEPRQRPGGKGLVLAACRSSTRFAKPLKTRSGSLLSVASSSSNTTRFAPTNELADAAQLAKNVDGRCVCPDAEDLRSRAFENPQKGYAFLLSRFPGQARNEDRSVSVRTRRDRAPPTPLASALLRLPLRRGNVGQSSPFCGALWYGRDVLEFRRISMFMSRIAATSL